MPTFSRRSLNHLDTCHFSLQRLFLEVIKERDCTILQGFRGKDDQEKAFNEGKSKAHWGQSKHNYSPSCAVDVMPYPIDWNDIKGITEFAKYVLSVAKKLDIKIVWGADWDSDGIPWERENWEIDGPHYELKDTSGSVLPK